ncbi:DUF6082 family protein [Streptomyces sp. NPDC059477]|uniref:DUF6082 family protein n=1 Tax=Streptomyces sp. NPDC059477 TaxID=3346847 RepID=UPI003691CE12
MAIRSFGARALGVVAAAGLTTGVLIALAAQRRTLESLHARLEHLEEQAPTPSHANLARQQHQHWELLSKAIDDPELAEVLDHYDVSLSPKQRRQYLFANALYTNLLFYYRIGNLSKEEFFQHVRGMLQNPVVREYWKAGRQQRASITDTDEAELGQIVDDLLRALDDADEEWWVVGMPPGEEG